MSRMKIALCLMAQDFDKLKQQFDENKDGPQDMYEIRVDFLLNKAYEDIEGINEVISYMRAKGVREDKEIILTLRTENEGGVVDLSQSDYQSMIQRYISESWADIIDIEAFGSDNRDAIEFLTSMAHENDKKVILSNHELKSTPKKEEIVLRLLTMERMGADIPKVAYMAAKEEDPETLLAAAEEAKKIMKVPFVALSMGEAGRATRICGGDFGSTISFGFAKDVSAAPGQMKVTELKRLMDEYYE